MLRWMTPFLVAILAIPATAEAAGPAGKAAARRAASQLPPGLPRANYKFRTMVASAAPPSAQALYDGPDVMFTPSPRYVRYAPPAVALLPEPVYVPWPGYFGPSVAYEYRLPWSAGPRGPYGYRCGVNSYGNSWC
ncbi:MAG: hypothetical protein V4517_18825 [Pseudomonadota bacterium]